MRGLYVHIPFCSVKCFYCDFAAFSGQGRTVRRYLAAIEREWEGGETGETLYIGGGTPSELDEGSLESLLALTAARLGPLEGLSEATFEANPESLTPPKTRLLRRSGITRLSLGLQASQDRLLKAAGRRHGWADFLGVFRRARREGFANLSVDLMFGLPDQTVADLEETLDRVLDLGPEHVSAYGLQVEDRTLFSKRGVRAEEDLLRVMHETVTDRLAEAGFVHYEISNFARPGRRSVHNELYWKGEEYRGLGCSAASFIGGRRWSNHWRLDDYLRAVESGRAPVEEEERLEGKARAGERALLGLRRLEGIEPDPVTLRAFGRDLGELEGVGLLERAGDRVRLTREGVFLANRVFERFVPPWT